MKIIKIAKSLSQAIKDYTGDRLKGGISDKKKVNDFPMPAIKAGVKVELEHTTDLDIALEIVMDHLTEDVKYYEKLKTIEGH